MSEENTPAVQQPGRAVAVRERIVVSNPMGVMDTARFEHLGRVGTVMARAALLPKSLTHFKEGDKENPFDFEVVQARAIIIASFADNLHADPMMVAQCVSFVQGRMMFEGKLIHALIEGRLGVRLRYEFGKKDAATRVFTPLEDEKLPSGEDRSLAVRVSATFDDEDFARTIDGSVAQWHTGAKGAWSSPYAWKRQLRYMGAREWCRAHSPTIMLGVLTDDEVEFNQDLIENEPRAPRPKRNLRAALGKPDDAAVVEPAAGDDEKAPGFDADRVAADLDGDDSKPAVDEVKDAEFTEGGGDVVDDDGVVTEGGQGDEGGEEVWPCSESFDGPAPAGEVYQLAIDDLIPGPDGIRTCRVYKDGVEHATVTREGAASYPEYEAHPVATEGDAQPQGGSPAAEAGQDDQGFPGDRKDAEEDPPWADGTKDEPGIRSDPENRVDPGPPGPMQLIVQATEWKAIKTILGNATGGEDFKALDADDQSMFRAMVWMHVEKVCPFDYATDASAFRLWIETQEGAEGAALIREKVEVLKTSEGYARLTPLQAGDLGRVIENRITLIEADD